MPNLKLNSKKTSKRQRHERVTLETEEANFASTSKKSNSGSSQAVHSQPKPTYDTSAEAINVNTLEQIPDKLESFIAELPAMSAASTVQIDERDDLTSINSARNLNNAPAKSGSSSKSKLGKIKSGYSHFPFTKDLVQSKRESISPEKVQQFRNSHDIHITGAHVDLHDSKWDPSLDWNEAGLPLPLMKVLEQLNYKNPTPVQAQCLSLIMGGYDLVGIAPTGSGKTAAFLIPLCRHIVANQETYKKHSSGGPYAVILVPTRELCVQISRELEPWIEALSLASLSCYGGSNIAQQISRLVRKNCDIIVATPGRLIDLLAANNGRVLSLESVTYLVVDETDRMFDLGFGPQVKKIVDSIRPDRQTIVFSATMLPAMEVLVDRILVDPLKVSIGTRSTVPSNVEQKVVLVNSDEKQNLLLDTLHSWKNGNAIVFVNTQIQADMSNIKLLSKGIKCQTLHGGMDQRDREDVINEFKSGGLSVLVATSVAARGLDVKNSNLVINYDAASHHEDYVHRAGRTGRAGKNGFCLTILEPEQTREAFQLSTSVKLDDPQLQSMAESYARFAEKNSNKRLGFGGHGLAKLESKWTQQKTVEQGAYNPETDAPKVGENDDEIEIMKHGTSFVAFLSINDAPKAARVAVTATSSQNKIIEEYHVSLTLKGTFLSNPRPSVPKDAKLGIQIESASKRDVVLAYRSMQHVSTDKTAEVALSGKYSSF